MRPGHHNVARASGHCRGQAMVESCIVIVFLCLLFLGLFQLLHAYVARDVLNHAAARAARAKTVGFNQWMVAKTMRVAAIPNAGSLLTPAGSSADPALVNALATMKVGELWDFAMQSVPKAPTIDIELARIPQYLDSYNSPTAKNVLDYERWDTIQFDLTSSAGVIIDPTAAGTFTVRVKQPYDLIASLDALANDDVKGLADDPGKLALIGRYDIEAQYPLYLEDAYW